MSLLIVSATRQSREAFVIKTMLGQSLSRVSSLTPLSLIAFFENTRPLGACYNEVIEQAAPDDMLVFIHDDVFIDDWMMGWRVQEALMHFDVVGVAGNRRRQPGQETWYMQPGRLEGGAREINTFDQGWLSGAVGHGSARD